jgi:cysteinylglycine-S-conjugate dipeptidase
MVPIDVLRSRSLELLAAWTPIRSTAANPAGLARMAEEVAHFLRDRLGAELVAEGAGCTPPLVHARIDRGRRSTILLYNMYDVMEAPASSWSVDPFAGTLADMPGRGPCFVGRGAENNKGPLAGMLVALEALLAADALPANVEVLIEGEEESGSRQLRRYLLDPASPVAPCGVALFPSLSEYGGGQPRIYLGSKGIAHGRIRVAGGGNDMPRAPAHSSNAPWIANPAWRLAEALAALGSGPTGALGADPLPADAAPVLDALAASFDPAAELAFRSTDRFAVPGDARALLETVLTGMNLNIAHLASTPAEGRAVIPCTAEARFDLRLPPQRAPGPVLEMLRARLAPFGAELIVEDEMSGHRFPPTAPGVAALRDTYRGFGIDAPVWPWMIGAAPAHAFAARAGAFLLGGLGWGGNAHGIDEFVTLAGLDRYLASLLAWLPATAAELEGAP